MGRAQLQSFLENIYKNIDDKEIWIYGIGNSMDLYCNGLKRINLRISGYCLDAGFEETAENIYNEKPVKNIVDLERQNVRILVFSFNISSMRNMLQKAVKLGFEAYLLDQIVLSYYRDKVMMVYDLLEDKKSKDILEEVIKCRADGRYPQVGFWNGNSYFCWPEFTMKNTGKVFIDCGCYVGDTIEKYIWEKEGSFDRIIGFEPDETNNKAINYRIDRLSKEWNVEGKISVINAGVGEETKRLSFMRHRDGLGSVFSEKGDRTEQIYALDDFLKEKYDYLKADIESFEFLMLKGAEKTIKKWKPCLAICIYHNAVDLFDIPLLIKKIDSKYHFAVRHHSNTFSETVLYAWVE